MPILNSMWKILAALKVICPFPGTFSASLCYIIVNMSKEKSTVWEKLSKSLEKNSKSGEGCVYCRQAVVTAIAMEEKG